VNYQSHLKNISHCPVTDIAASAEVSGSWKTLSLRTPSTLLCSRFLSLSLSALPLWGFFQVDLESFKIEQFEFHCLAVTPAAACSWDCSHTSSRLRLNEVRGGAGVRRELLASLWRWYCLQAVSRLKICTSLC